VLTRRRNHSCAALAAVAAIVAAFSTAPSARAESTTCTGTIGPQTIAGNVVVPAGATCFLLNDTVNGSVFVHQSGWLNLSAVCGPEGPSDCRGTTVAGNVVASHARMVGFDFSHVEGNVIVDNTDFVGFYRSFIAGDLILIRNREVFFQGSGTGGNVVCRNNLLVTGNFPTEECAGV
jgi:predicted acyltransferase (DUF342 family)